MDPNAPDPLGLEGQVIGEKYRIRSLCGRGGHSLVYRADHLVWGTPVAIKMFTCLSSVDDSMREQLLREFIQEGKLITELSTRTAAIVQARDVGTFVSRDGVWMPYMVLEWLDGIALGDHLLQRGATYA